ncbi:MAG: hypothetical protein Q4E09_03345 [Eubacteriales bacterium]|nr:hypothetical protein [Eubacteriales bacterium]
MMKLSKGEKAVHLMFIISLIMANPPILGLVNNYAKDNPLTFGYPTMWVWLEFWYAVAIAAFLIGALTIRNWQTEEQDAKITAEMQADHKERG